MSKKDFTKRWLKGHREYMYQQALGKLIEGKVDPQYVEKRWDKVKEIKRG